MVLLGHQLELREKLDLTTGWTNLELSVVFD
jgi:hypothetical protein